MHHPTTSPHYPPPPFPTAHPKSSPSGSISVFWPPTPHRLALHERTTPNTIATSYGPPHHLPASPTITISTSAHEPEPWRLGFAFRPPPCLAFRERTTPPPLPPHLHPPTAPLHPPPPPPPTHH